MDFSWTQQQQELLSEVESFARQSLSDADLIEADRLSRFDHQAWLACGQFGMQGLTVPEEYGGRGLDPLTTVAVLERLGYLCRDNGLLFSINAHLWTACMPIVAFGSPEQKQNFLPGLASGRLIGGNATSEPDAGSDTFGMRTLASRDGDRYILNGRKIYVSNGPVADVLVVFATVDPARGPHGITAFIVEKGISGLTVTRQMEKMGLRTSPMAELVFENCPVPAANRLGKEGAGPSLFNHSMNWERGCIMASSVGTMQRLLETSIQFAKNRKQFGQPIGKFQLVADKVVNMKLRLESARHMLYHGAWLRSQGRTAMLEAAMTKLHISECLVDFCVHLMQIHGAAGYMTDRQIEREMRDALASKFYSGTNEIQRTIVAALLGVS